MKLFFVEPFLTFSLIGMFVIWSHSSLPVDSRLVKGSFHVSPAPSPVTRRREEEPSRFHSNLPISKNKPARLPPSHPNLNSRGAGHRVHNNLGKKIGVLFIGIVGALQVVVVGFLGFKRRQILGMKDRHDVSA